VVVVTPKQVADISGDEQGLLQKCRVRNDNIRDATTQLDLLLQLFHHTVIERKEENVAGVFSRVDV